MTAQKRLSLTTIAAISVAFITLIILVTISFRDYGSNHSKLKANLAADLIEDGLTAHMVNGMMDGRGFFLQKIENAQNIDSLWITRSPSVIKQYGKGFNNEIPRDDIDREVIKTGKPYEQLIEGAHRVKMRYTVPYIATASGNPNCINCHEAKEGETLGTISMIFDVTETRNEAIVTILYIIGVSIIVIFILLWVINHSLKPFMSLFNSINNVMKSAKEGDYTKRVDSSASFKDGQQVAQWINSFFDKLEDTLHDIQKTVKDFFISSHTIESNDPLLEVKDVVTEMSDIYRFKKTIEFDESIEDVYGRLASVLKHNLYLNNFQFVQSNTHNGETKCVYNCQISDYEVPQNCRALRTKQTVFSDQFPDICESCSVKNKHYICIPYTISDDFDFVINFIAPDEEYLQEIKNLMPKIDNYIESARPELVSKNLTQILRHASTVDKLTGLYNRKYLDEYIDKAVPQALRSNISYGVLMIDIDFFKAVNDTYGHDVGDIVIERLSTVLKTSIRESDVAFRYGGEEFLVLLHNCDEDKIEYISEKIRTNFAKESIQTVSGKSFKKTLSIGFSYFPANADSIWKCIKFADIALYAAKNGGRNQVVGFKESMLGDGDLKNTYKPE